MGRRLRPNQPGAIYHLTARVNLREPLFVGIEGTVSELVCEATARAGSTLLAYAVMPNHLHIVIIQGALPLSAVMQPLMRQLALRIHHRTGREGHVFERRFRENTCGDPDYARNAIAYTHLNPVRAGLCSHPDEYRWSSHLDYAGVATARGGVADRVGLRLFAERPGIPVAAARRHYREYIRWRRSTDLLLDEGAECSSRPPRTDGDLEFWQSTRDWRQFPPDRRTAPDLTAIAREAIARSDVGIDLDVLRSGGSARPLVRLRREVIANCVRAGYRTTAIAKFLRISTSTVSLVAAPLRQTR